MNASRHRSSLVSRQGRSTEDLRRGNSNHRRLDFESLEDRRMLALFTVSNLDDGIVNASGELPGSLRQAIFDANDTPGADTIVFASGPGEAFAGDAVVRLTSGELEITETLSIDGSTAGGAVVITGDALGNDITDSLNITDVAASTTANVLSDNSRVLNFSAMSGELTLADLTITGGSTTSGNANGGGIRTDAGNVTLTSSIVSGNSTTGNSANGGGIATESGNVTLSSSTVSGNSTTGNFADGAGIVTDSGNVTLFSSTVSGNSTTGEYAYGGGISTYSGNVTLTSSTVSGNSTYEYFAYGGGISTFSGNVTLSSSTVSQNSTAGLYAYGGGIRTASGNVMLSRSTVSGNQSNDDGGGISTFSGSVTLSNSTVSDNSSLAFLAFGGGIRTFSGAVTLSSSTVSGNEAMGEGGGIFVFNTIIDPVFTITNSIISGNLQSVTAPGVGTPNNLVSDPDSPRTINYSLIDVTDLTVGGNGNQIGTLLAPINPMLGPLAFNGGPTQTHALLPGSLALDAGDPAFTSPPDFDQRGPGFSRVQFGRVDIGAFEVQAVVPAAVGDYNLDGITNGADFTLWRDTLGTTGIAPFSGADGTGDGAVTVADYDVWLSHFGFQYTPPAHNVTAVASSSVVVSTVDSTPPSLDAAPAVPVLVPATDAAFAFFALPATEDQTPARPAAAESAAASVRESSLLLLALDREVEVPDAIVDPLEEADAEQPTDEQPTDEQPTNEALAVALGAF